MSDQAVRFSGGFGFSGALFITFLVLKLTGVITWSWWWVTAPLWIPYLLLAVAGLSALIIWGLFRLFESEEKKNVRKARTALRNYAKALR